MYMIWREQAKRQIKFEHFLDKPLKATIIIHSPRWLTKKGTIAKLDLDNRLKVLIDSFEMATKIGDQNIWEIVTRKVHGPRTFIEFKVELYRAVEKVVDHV